MSNPKSSEELKQSTELTDLQPEIRELTPQEAEQTQGGLLPAVHTTNLLPAVQPGQLNFTNTMLPPGPCGPV